MLTDLQIATLIDKYLREQDRFDKMSAYVARRLTQQLRATTIPHLPTFRAKDSASLRAKLARDRTSHEYEALEREFSPSILDLAGVRILLYRPQDEEPVCEEIERLFVVPPEDRFRRNFLTPGGYHARHRVVRIRDEVIEAEPSLTNLGGVLCEVQVVTLGDHIWNELEHDIRYKTPAGQPSEAQLRMLRVLREQLNTVRASVEELMDASDQQRAAQLTTIDSPEDLSDALKVRIGRRPRGDIEQLWRLLVGVFRELTLTTLDGLPLSEADLNDASARLEAANVTQRDEVALVVSAMWPAYQEDFSDVVGSWRGRPGPVVRLLQTLRRAQDGTI
jgi:ppGpp synthetase/RelA/SpoT-type nucleotidyltranferase